MNVDMRNSEGYLDLTAYEAIKKVEQEQRSGRAFRPIVYICSPYAGDIAGNVDAARRYSRFAVDKGYIPIAPHLLFPQFLDDADPDERELGLFFGNAIMSKCETGDGFRESSSSLYQAYRNYCIDTNEYVRSTADFYFAMESAGYERVTLNRKRYFKGVRLRTDVDDAGDDFLT